MNNFSKLDFKKRERFLKKELRLVSLKAVHHDMSKSQRLRMRAQRKMGLLASANRTKIRNRCFITSRGKSVYKHFGISRIMFRKLGHEGLILGFTKSSW